MTANLVRQLVQVLVMGETLGLKSVMRPDGVIHDPRFGPVHPERFGELAAAWRNLTSGRDPRWIAVTVAPQRSVAEFETGEACGDSHGRLSVAAVADHDGDRLRRVRLYQRWSCERVPHAGSTDTERLPAALTGIVARYHEGLESGRLERAVACFGDASFVHSGDVTSATPDACGPGSTRVHRGLEGVAAYHSAALAGGGVALTPLTVTDDGVRCAVEYEGQRHGGTHRWFGVSVYEQNGAGLIRGARVYDPAIAGR